MFKIGELAALAGVSVRTLHHYDDIGLVVPSARSEAGYRLYTERDLERLQQVLFYRAIGFALEDIARALADPTFDRRAALASHRKKLEEQAERTRGLLDLVDRTLRSIEKGETMDPKEMFTGFDEEAKARWGKTDAYAESMRRTKSYTRADWSRIQADADAITIALAELMKSGVPATDARAMDLAERHRMHIDRWFYACTCRIHVGLGEMYVADERFARNYEKHHDGLAAYFRDAIAANATRGVTP